ncbi:hypothetical protein ACSU64_01675 [Bacillaceae bacterium C204]|uniref:hypothetical protein n=1 Tax=Neobacillus sp. 204 TaxID=3383351 RepID=UPI0039785B9E
MYLIKILASLFIIGISVTFLIRSIQLLFFSILKLFVWVFSGIAGPILNLLHLLLSRISSKGSKSILEGSDDLKEAGNYQEQSKINLGRFPFETLREWWLRVGITDSEEIIEIFNKVRYGGFTFSKEETTRISRKIRQIRQKLKDL